MKKSEITKSEIEKCEMQIRDLQILKQELESKMIEQLTEESQFRIGEVVNVKHSYEVQKGIFKGYRIKYGGIEPVVFKIKKDGSPSKNEIYIFTSTKIEKIEQ